MKQLAKIAACGSAVSMLSIMGASLSTGTASAIALHPGGYLQAAAAAPPIVLPQPAAGSHYTIAYIPGCTCDPYFATETAGFLAAAKQVGISTIVQGPADFNPTQQTTVLEAVVQKHPSAIVINPTNLTAMVAPINAAIAAGIPVMTTGNFVDTTKIFTAVAADSYVGGEVAAKALEKWIPNGGQVVYMDINPGVTSLSEHEQGFDKIMRANKKFTILPTLYANENSATQAADIIEGEITAHPKLAGVFASNVITAEGVANGIVGMSEAGKIKVVGYDASTQEVAALQNHSLTGLISQSPYTLGYMDIANSIKYLNGDHNLPKMQLLQPILIDLANLNQPNIQKAIYHATPY